jgi:hypothetical protein
MPGVKIQGWVGASFFTSQWPMSASDLTPP